MVVVLDEALEDRSNMICGANKLDYHFRNVTPETRFHLDRRASVRTVSEGEGCPICNAHAACRQSRGSGTYLQARLRYSESMGARVLDPNGKEVTPIMGSYGIGIERILTACVEQSLR